jgi:predicted  nucleic acid-binding Zn-ribbon protein
MAHNEEPTNNDILEAINSYATNTDRRLEKIECRLDGIDNRLDGIDNRLDGIDNRLDGIDNRLDGMNSRLMRVESQMVTKEYLDDKLADLKGDILTILRKEDRRVTALVEIMQKKNLLSVEEVKFLETMQPLIPTSTI